MCCTASRFITILNAQRLTHRVGVVTSVVEDLQLPSSMYIQNIYAYPCRDLLEGFGLNQAQDRFTWGSFGSSVHESQLEIPQFRRLRQFFAPHVQGMGASPGVVSNCAAAVTASDMGGVLEELTDCHIWADHPATSHRALPEPFPRYRTAHPAAEGDWMSWLTL